MIESITPPILNAFLSCAVGALFTALLATVKGKRKMQNALAQGVLALLHYRLYAECEKIIEKKSMTKQELEDLTHLYAAYHDLGGNGAGTKLYKSAISQRLVVGSYKQ